VVAVFLSASLSQVPGLSFFSSLVVLQSLHRLPEIQCNRAAGGHCLTLYLGSDAFCLSVFVGELITKDERLVAVA